MQVLATIRLPGQAWQKLPDVELGPLDHRDYVDVLSVAGDVVDDAVLDRLPSLRLVASYGVGYDNIDVKACRARGVEVTNTPGVLDAATADLAFALLLATRRRLVEGDRHVRGGDWGTGWSQTPFLGREVTGSTLGIVGLGRIGGAMGRRARGFEMRVVYHQRTPETTGLISRERLALLRDGATLVNTARGGLVDEEALVQELVSGRISAGLDVFAHEPHVPHELFDLQNVVLTPHIASDTIETRAAMSRVVVDNILAFQRGVPLPNPVT